MLRQMHDATAEYTDSAAQWRQPVREPQEVICHNDVAPYNMVFLDGCLTGLIDFDMASPGPRLWDLAYLAYWMVPLTSATNPDDGPLDEAARRERLDTLLEAYGMGFPIPDILRMAQERLRHLAVFSDDLAEDTGRIELHDHAVLYRTDEGYIEYLINRLRD
jgi:Ser/Thr protein kinase RdoA (MazF antagonist)